MSDDLTRQPSRRLAAAWGVLAALVVGTLAVGAWGLTASRSGPDAGTHPAVIGDPIEVPGGTLRVDRAMYEQPMVAPTSGPLAGSMPMSSAPGTALPEPRKGFSRLDVDVTLYAGTAAGLKFRAEDFVITSSDGARASSIGSDVGPDELPAGTAVSRIIAFDVPTKAHDLVLQMQGARRPIQLRLAPAPSGQHHH